MDKTKYDLKITNNEGVSDYQSLDKVETAFKIIECLLDLELESKDEINSHNFIGYTLLLDSQELSEKTPDVQGRYKKSITGHNVFFSRMWDKEKLEKLIQYAADKYPNVFTIEESKNIGGNEEGIKYFWMNAKLKDWDVDKIGIGEENSYTTHNEKGNKRKFYADIEKLKKEDLIIVYQGSPHSMIKGLLKITKPVTPNGDARSLLCSEHDTSSAATR